MAQAVVLCGMLMLAAGTAAAATNDNFANATAVSLGTVTTAINTGGYTKEISEPIASAGSGGASAWWVWNSGSFSGSVVCSTNGSNFDTVLDIWTGAALASLSRVAFSDDYTYGGLVNGAARTSMVSFTAVANTTYHFRVDGYPPPASSGTGNVVFALQSNPTATIRMTTPAYENSISGVWTISFSSSLVDQVPIYWTAGGGTAAVGHYSIPQTSPILMPPNSFSTTVTLNTTDDGIVTENTTVINTLQGALYGNYLLGAPSSSVLTIVDAESPQLYVNQAATGSNTGTSWPNAYTDLHAALANAVSGNQIWVAQGTYFTTAQSDSFQLNAGVSLYGGFTGTEGNLALRNRFTHKTTLNGTYGSGVNSFHVVTGQDEALIDGFTITGGNANSFSFPDDFGGGLLAYNTAPEVRGCTFIGNRATEGGGAMLMYSRNVPPLVDSCYFLNNSCTDATSPDGGGAMLISNQSFTDAGTVSNCVFANNTTNNTAASSGGGGAIFALDYTFGSITNCTFYGNTNSAAGPGGAIYNEDSSGLFVLNSIFSSNTNVNGPSSLGIIQPPGSSSQQAQSCIFQEPTIEGFSDSGGNMVNVNPGFLNTASLAGADGIFGTADDGLSLSSTSLAVDSGTSVPPPANDISNHGRPLGAGTDRGAYELTAIIYVKSGGNAASSGNTWATATTLPHALVIALSGNQIWVAGGTYSPSTTSAPATTFQMVTGVQMFGGFAGNEVSLGARDTTLNHSILSGSVSNSLHVVTGANDSRLDGFIITSGNANGGSFPDYGGGALLCNGTAPTIYGCIFSANNAGVDGGALFIHNPCSPTFANCVFTGNTCGSNGGVMECEFGATPSFTNCTFANNISTGSRGGAAELFANPSLALTNCIFWGDSSPEFFLNGSTGTSFSSCDIQGGVPSGCVDGGNNLNANPLFLNPSLPAGSDAQLGTADDGLIVCGLSPCLDVGNAISAPANDVDQSVRPLGPGDDLGGYETPYVSIFATLPNASKAANSGAPTNGLFTLVRGGNLSQPLTVTLGVSGTAVANIDYTALTATVTFPANSSSVFVLVPVIATSQAGGTVTVIASVVPSVPGNANAYATSLGFGSAMVSIANLNTPGVIIIPIGGFVPSLTNVLLSNQAAGPNPTFTVQLNSKPTSSVTVNLASSNIAEGTLSVTSVTFTTGNWNVPVPVIILGVNDFIAHGPQNYSIVSSGASSLDPIYNRNLTVVPAAPQTVFGTAMPFVAQSGNNWQVKVNGVSRVAASFGVGNSAGNALITLATPAQTNDSVVIQYLSEESFASNGAVVTFDTTFPVVLAKPNSWVVSVNGVVQPTFAYMIANDGSGFGKVTFTTAPAAGTVLVQADEVAAQNANTNSIGVTLSVTSVAVVEGGITANYTVSLNSQPSNGNVVINLAASNLAIPGAGNVFTNVPSLTFTPVRNLSVAGTTSGYNVPQTVTVSASRDNNVEAAGFGNYAGTVAQSISASVGCDYLGLGVTAISVAIKDQDVAGISLSPSSGLVTSENGAPDSPFQVTLSSRPLNTVQLKLVCEDVVDDGGGNPNGGVFDIGGPQLITTVIKLNFTPVDGQVIGGAIGNQTSGWNVPQTINLQGLRGTSGTTGSTIYWVDLNAHPTVSGAGDSNYSTLPSGQLMQCLNTDIDRAGILVSAGQLHVVRGDPVGQTFTIQLATNPASTNVVAIDFTDSLSGLITVSPSTVVFSPTRPWNVPVTVQVTAAEDGVVDVQSQIDTLSYSAISSNPSYDGLAGGLPVTVEDDGVAGLMVTPVNGLVTTENGGTATFDVGLLSKPSSGSAVTVHLTSSNLGAGILSQQFYSATTTTAGANSTITFPTTANLSNIATNMLIKIGGLGPNGGAISQVMGIGANSITVTPALNAFNGAESVYIMPSLAVASGTSSAGQSVITFPLVADLSQVFEGQSVLVTGLSGPSATFTSSVRYVDRSGMTVTVAGTLPGGGTGTVWFSAGPMQLVIAAANYQATQTITVIGMHNLQVNGNVNYEVDISATSADPRYNTSQTITNGGATSIFNYGIPFVVYDGSNWTVTQGGTDLSGYTITNSGGYATVTLGTALSGAVTLTYHPTVGLTNLDVDSAHLVVTPLDNTTIFPIPASPSSAHFYVALTSEPTSDVTVQLQTSNPSKGLVSPQFLTFTQSTPNGVMGWDQPHLVTIDAVGSAVADGSVSYSVSMLPASSADPNYNTLIAPGVTLATVDPRSAGVVVAPLSPPLVTNAQTPITAQFTVVLASQPTAPVTIPISSSNPSKGMPSVNSLSFDAGDWSLVKTVTVNGIANASAQGDVPYQIVFGQPATSDPGYAVLSVAPVAIIGRDNNLAGYVISDPTSQTGHIFSFPPDASLQTTDLGGAAAFEIALTSQPIGSSQVTINFATSDTSLGNPQPASVTFNANDWNQPVIVNVIGGNAGNSDVDAPYSILSPSVVSADPGYNGVAITPVPYINIAQNKVPTLSTIANVSVNENQVLPTIVSLSGITTGQPAEVNALVVTASSDNQTLLPNASLIVGYTSVTPVPSTGTLTFAPVHNQSGVANVTVTVTSRDLSGPPTFRGGDKSFSQTFAVNVNFVNQAPAFSLVSTVLPTISGPLILEDSGFQSVANWATGISVGPPVESTQHGSFLCINDNNPLFSIQPAIDPLSGTLTFTLAPTAFGSATVTVLLLDDGGVLNGGVNSSPAQTFVITVTPVNHAPTFTTAGDISVQEGVGSTVFPNWATGISPGPADEASQTLTFTLAFTGPNAAVSPSLFSIQPSVDLAGNLTFTTMPHSRGYAQLALTLTDSGNTLNGGQNSSVQFFNITINPVNSPPVVTVSAASGRKVPIGTSTVIQPTDLFATDVDSTVPFPIHDPGLIFTLQLVPGNGTLFDNGVALGVNATFTQQDIINGFMSYTHNGGTSASDGFAFTVSDNAILAGSVSSAPPLPVSTLPPAVSALQVFPITIDRSNPVVVLTPAGPLPFLDHGPAELLAGTASVSDPLQPSFSGGFITVNFASGASSADVIAIDTTGSITLSGATVLYNDGTGAVPFGTLSATQGASGTVMTVSSLTGAATTASVAAFIQRLTYQNTAVSPSNPLTTPVTRRVVEVAVQDANSDSSQLALLAIDVTSISHAPLITSSALVVTSENVPISGMVTAVDVDGTSLTYTVTGIPALGTVVIDPVSGIYTFTPIANVTGTGGFHVHVTDGGSTSSDQDIAVTITSDSPLEPFITSNPPELTEQNQTVIYNVVGASPGTTTPTFTVIGLPAGSYTLAANGQSATLTLLPTLTATAGYLTFGILITDPTNVLSGVQPVTLLIVPTPAAGG